MPVNQRHMLILSGILVSLIILTWTCPVPAQDAPCEFDAEEPSLAHARTAFRAADYACAGQEAQAVLTDSSLSQKTRADAHALLAAVFYSTTDDPEDRRRLTREQLIMVFRTDRNWRGRPDIAGAGFLTLVNDARELVDWLVKTSPELVEQPVAEQDTTPLKTPGGTPWYRKWWAIGSGVGLVATALVLMAGGDEESDPTVERDTLPGFPPPPS